MGSGSSSSSSATIDTSIAVNLLSQAVMNCASNTAVTQSFDVTGNFNAINGVKQVQAIQFSTSCTQTSQNIANLQQQIANALQQAASATGSGITSALGASSSNTNTTIAQDVQQNITEKSIQNIVNNCAAQQSIIISGNNNIVNNFSQEQTMSIVQSNCQNAINSLQSVQAINNQLAQSSTAVTTNPISDIISSIGSAIAGIGWYSGISFGTTFFLLLIYSGSIFFIDI